MFIVVLDLLDLGVQKAQRMCLGIYLHTELPAWYMNLWSLAMWIPEVCIPQNSSNTMRK